MHLKVMTIDAMTAADGVGMEIMRTVMKSRAKFGLIAPALPVGTNLMLAVK